MEKKKEDGMTDLEIIKHHIRNIRIDGNIEINQEDCDKINVAATRMAAEIERLLNIIVENQKEMSRLRNEAVKLMIERDSLKAAFAEKPEVVFCKDCNIFQHCFIQKGYKLEFCSFGRKEAKDEVICGREEE